MKIEEYRPEPPRPLPPKRTRALPKIALGALLAGTFLATFAVLHRQEEGGNADPTQPKPMIAQTPHRMETPPLRSAPALGSIERIAQCLSARMLDSGELSQVMQALKDQTDAPQPSVTPALSGPLDLQNITDEQAAEFSGLLTQINGQLGVRAQIAFQQGLTDGRCTLAPHEAATLPPPRWPDSKLQ